MKSIYYCVGTLALLLIFSAVPVSAEEGEEIKFEDREEYRSETRERYEDSDGRRIEVRSEQRAKMDEGREEYRSETRERYEGDAEEREERREERRIMLSERAKDRIEGYLGRIVARMSAMAGRLDNIANRLDARLELIAETGVDTTEAELLLAEARTSIEAAQIAILELETAGGELVEEVEMSTGAGASAEVRVSPRDTLLEVKELAAAARESLKTAHAALVSAVEGIKNLNLSASVLNSVE